MGMKRDAVPQALAVQKNLMGTQAALFVSGVWAAWSFSEQPMRGPRCVRACRRQAVALLMALAIELALPFESAITLRRLVFENHTH
jgi:hypothetical protein